MKLNFEVSKEGIAYQGVVSIIRMANLAVILMGYLQSYPSLAKFYLSPFSLPKLWIQFRKLNFCIPGFGGEEL